MTHLYAIRYATPVILKEASVGCRGFVISDPLEMSEYVFGKRNDSIGVSALALYTSLGDCQNISAVFNDYHTEPLSGAVYGVEYSGGEDKELEEKDVRLAEYLCRLEQLSTYDALDLFCQFFARLAKKYDALVALNQGRRHRTRAPASKKKAPAKDSTKDESEEGEEGSAEELDSGAVPVGKRPRKEEKDKKVSVGAKKYADGKKRDETVLALSLELKKDDVVEPKAGKEKEKEREKEKEKVKEEKVKTKN